MIRLGIKISLSILLATASLTALAYIPKFWMIMSRTAENHGRGIYKVIQDVTFLHKEEPLIVRETWHIKDGESMRLKVEGLGEAKNSIQYNIIYQQGKRYFIDSQGVKKTNLAGSDWFEPYFHFRFSKKIKPKMLAKKMIPSSALEKPSRFQPKTEDDKTEMQKEDFLRLSRFGGVVTYNIGPLPQANANQALPGMWIEQDQFLIRKIRLSPQSEVVASKYHRYGRGMNLPRFREVSWDQGKAEVRVLSVKPLSAYRKIKMLFSHKSLDPGKNPKISNKPFEDPVLTDFYKRFR